MSQYFTSRALMEMLQSIEQRLITLQQNQDTMAGNLHDLTQTVRQMNATTEQLPPPTLPEDIEHPAIGHDPAVSHINSALKRIMDKDDVKQEYTFLSALTKKLVNEYRLRHPDQTGQTWVKLPSVAQKSMVGAFTQESCSAQIHVERAKSQWISQVMTRHTWAALER